MTMHHYLLCYSFPADYLERRGLYRDAHLRHAWEAQRAGFLELGGAVADPLDMGMLLFKASSPAKIEEFARHDPYVVNGLVTAWRIREWRTVVGATAIDPTRPAEPG